MILKQHCPFCKTKQDVMNVIENSSKRTTFFKCLHSSTIYFKQAEDINIVSRDNNKPFQFQKEGIAFGINSGNRALILDEMGLGKTIQGLGIALESKARTLIVVKAGLRMQWLKQCVNWTSFAAQIIENEKEPDLGLKFCIISIDLLHRFKEPEKFTNRFKFDLLILDECQSIKNHDSKRTNALRNISTHILGFIALSGTPIKNNALEYFPVLNLARPDLFPTLVGYQNIFCDTYYSGWTLKVGGIKDAKKFKDYTKDFIIRRTRSEVLPQLPKILRTARFEELGKDVEQAYKQTLRDFQDFYGSESSGLERATNILSYLTKMRHLTGISKINGVANYIEEFLEETDKKICIFLHHKDVNTLLVDKVNSFIKEMPKTYGGPVLTLQSEHNSFQRNDIIKKFQESDSRVLIASTLAAGEGVDGIQNVCSDIIIMERQWNPANEEQVEGRIERMGQEAQKITATYFIATGTVDEFFAEIVEKKRGYMNSTLDGKDYQWDQSSIIQELAEVLNSQGSKRWGW